jgi:hypothetical protein
MQPIALLFLHRVAMLQVNGQEDVILWQRSYFKV